MDVRHHLNTAVASAFSKLDPRAIMHVAKQVDDTANTLLRDLHSDDPREALYTCAMFVMLLVAEGRFTDARNQAVLVSSLMIEDIRDDRPDVNGEGVIWRLQEQKWTEHARAMLTRANLLGFYLKSNLALQISAS